MEDRVKKHLPIDRGWAWVICLATFGLLSYTNGSAMCRGIIFVELQERFPDASASSLLWIFGVASITSRLFGIPTSFLLSKFSHRAVTSLSVILMCVGLVASGYAPSADYMYFFFGVTYGVGGGIMYVSALTAYTGYFEMRKALALGITTAGSGFGSLWLAPVLRALFDNFSFSSAMLLYAGLSLELLVLVRLLRPISFYEELATRKFEEIDDRIQWGGDVPSLVVDKVATEPDKTESSKKTITVHNQSRSINRRHSKTTTPEVKSLELHSDSQMFGSFLSVTKQQTGNQLDSDTISELFHSTSNFSGPVLLNQPETSAGDDENSNSAQKGQSFNWRVALRKEAIVLGLGMLAYGCGEGIVFQCLPPLGKEAGVSKETVSLALALCGGVEILCRILNGMLADRMLISAITQISLYMGITGTAAVLCAVISGLPGIVIMLVVMSACGTTVFSLLPIASGQLLGQENVVTALGLFRTYQAVATFLSIFSAGFLYETFGRWEFVYYFVGATMMGGGAINGSIAVYSYVNGRKQQNQDSQSH